MNDPALQLRVAGNSKGKVWVKFNGALVKLLALFQFTQIFDRAGKIVGLDKGQIGFAVFCGLTLHLCLFAWRQFGLKLACNFLSEISLNCEYVCQFTIVILSPDVLIVLCVDQLHIDADTIANAADTTFKNRTYTQRFSNFTKV